MIDQKEFERWIDSPDGIHAECEIRRWHGTNVVNSNQLWDWYTNIYLPQKQKEEVQTVVSHPRPIAEKREGNAVIREWRINEFLRS